MEFDMPRSRSGFTFVEILVAMAVLGVLSAIAVPKYRLMREKAWTAALKADLGELRIAEEAYWAENQRYSADTTQLDWRSTSDVQVTISSSDFDAGFQATARHQLMPASQCSMYVGRETILGTPSGEIVCGPATGSGPGMGTPAP
jgi:prepilin-type N-terminal cleavage/methylation domain-containing protein